MSEWQTADFDQTVPLAAADNYTSKVLLRHFYPIIQTKFVAPQKITTNALDSLIICTISNLYIP